MLDAISFLVTLLCLVNQPHVTRHPHIAWLLYIKPHHTDPPLCSIDPLSFRWSRWCICSLSCNHHHIGDTKRSQYWHTFRGCKLEPFQMYFAEFVSKISFIHAIISYVIYGAVSYKSAHFCFNDCENISLHLVMIKSEIWFNDHCSGLGNETMVRVVFYFIFYLYIRWYDIVNPMMLRHQRDKYNLSHYFQIISKKLWQ